MGFLLLVVPPVSFWGILKLVTSGLGDIRAIRDGAHQAARAIDACRSKFREAQDEASALALMENNRALLSDASAWAIHFSNARLGIMAIVIPLTIATVAVNIDSEKTVVWVSIWLIWVAAIFSFAALSWFQCRHLVKRHRNLVALGVAQADANTSAPARFWQDPHVWTVTVLTVFLIITTALRASTTAAASQSGGQSATREVRGTVTEISNSATGKTDLSISVTVEEE